MKKFNIWAKKYNKMKTEKTNAEINLGKINIFGIGKKKLKNKKNNRKNN